MPRVASYAGRHDGCAQIELVQRTLADFHPDKCIECTLCRIDSQTAAYFCVTFLLRTIFLYTIQFNLRLRHCCVVSQMKRPKESQNTIGKLQQKKCETQRTQTRAYAIFPRIMQARSRQQSDLALASPNRLLLTTFLM